MKVKETQPVICSFIVIIEDFKYRDALLTIEVECLLANRDTSNPIFKCASASCEEPYFKMGKSFWKKEFGTRQSNRIEKLCGEAIVNWIKTDSDKETD